LQTVVFYQPFGIRYRNKMQTRCQGLREQPASGGKELVAVPLLGPDAAVAAIQSGSCVGLGGSVNAGHPMALVRALIRSGVDDLTVVALTGGLDVDLLVAAGVVTALSAAYVGAEDLAGLPPAVRWASEDGRLDVWESEEGIHLASLRARAQRQPFATWTGGLGTCVTEHPLVEEARDDASGALYLKVRPMTVDTALLWAEAADEDGNLLLWGSDFGDEALISAADRRIAQVERIVPTAALARHSDRVAPWAADVIVVAPLSTHPFGGSALDPDDRWLRDYVEVVTAARRAGDPSQVRRFLDGWIVEPVDEDGYLTRVGMKRLRELMA
jgi:glutaconate CoA-transferase subunit A